MPGLQIFVSYSHRDPQYLENDSLLGFLRGLEAEENVTFWFDARLEAGTNWDDEIRSRLSSSDIALVLVSQSFLDSPYCTNVELSAFMDRCRVDGMIVFPIILSPCEWERHEWIRSRQFLPGGNETIEEHYQESGKRNRLFLRIRQELRSAIARAREARAARAQTPVQEPASRVAIAERRQITVFNCELTPLEIDGRPLAADDVPEILHELAPEFGRICAQLFEQHEARVVRSLGGSVTVYFGHPVPHEDDSRRAVRAGLTLVETVTKLSKRMEQELSVRLAVRVGIHTGMIVTSGRHQSQVSDADTFTVAAHLVEKAGAGEIVVSEPTHQLVADFFETSPAGHITFSQGRQLNAWRIVRDLGFQTRGQASQGRLSRLIGRDQEIALLLDRWREAKGGKGQAIMLRADPGLGKSRLLSETKSRTESDSRRWVECRCSPYHQNSSFFPVVAEYERWFGFEAGDDDETKLTKIERAVERFGSPEEIVPPLATIVSVPFATRYEGTSVNPREQKDLMLQVMVQLLIELSLESPLLFVMEDLHWADPSTVEFLDLLVEQLATVPILALFTFRPEFSPSPQWMNRDYVSQIAIDRLGRPATEEMIAAITAGKRLPREVLDEIYAKTEGFPLFIEDLTRMVIESDLLVEHDDHYELSGPFQSLAIPATLQETLMARLAKLATAKPVAQIGATIGREFVFEMLREVGGFDDKVLVEELNKLVATGLLYRRGLLSRAKYIFKHALVQEALQQSLVKKQRRQYHKLIAEVLEEKFHDIAETQPELVAYHYNEAGMAVNAIEHWQRAAKQALTRGANREALAHVSHALEALATLPDDAARWQRELDFRMMEGPALLALRGWASPEIGTCYSRARELCGRLPKTKQLFDTLHGLLKNDMIAARLDDEALPIGRELLAMAEESGDVDMLLESHAALCDTLFWAGRPVEALAHGMRGFELYDPAIHHASHAFVYGEDPAAMFFTYTAASLSLLGRRREALEISRKSLVMFECYSHVHSRVFLLAGITWSYIDGNDAENARRYAQTMIDLSLDGHFEAWNALATFYRGWAVAAAGALDEGIAMMADGRQRWHALGSGVESCWFPGRIAQLCLAAGRIDEASKWVDAGFERAGMCDDRNYLPELHRLRGEVLRATGGDDADAMQAFDAALRMSEEQGAAVLQLAAGTSKARLLAALDRHEEAAALLEGLTSGYGGDDDSPELLAARELLAGLGAKTTG